MTGTDLFEELPHFEDPNADNQSIEKISFFLPYFGDGGVERTTLILAREFVKYGASVDLLTLKPWGPFLNQMPEGVNLIDLGSRRTLASIPRLASYLRKRKPHALISAQSYANVAAIWAHRMAGRPGKIIVTERLAMSAATHHANNMRERFLPRLMRKSYPKADSIIANSEAGADDLAILLKMPRDKVGFIHNPTLHDEIYELAKEELHDPWFKEGEPPVILGVGRLAHQKDFHTLVRAFAQVRKETNSRLMILGDGEDRDSLTALANELGVAEDMRILGFVENPYKYMSNASVFVLSSRYEGLPNVLIESVGLGTPSVSTDCPGGSREILMDGAIGPLTPVGDPDALATAISGVLTEGSAARERVNRDKEHLERFSPKACLSSYLELIRNGK